MRVCPKNTLRTYTFGINFVLRCALVGGHEEAKVGARARVLNRGKETVGRAAIGIRKKT